MLNITHYQRNANQKYNEITRHTSQNGHHQKSTNNKCWRACGEKGALLHCWWKCKLILPVCRTVWRFLKKLGIKQLYDPAIPLLNIYPEKIIIQKDICTPLFIAALFKIARTWKQPRCPSTWLDKEAVVHIHSGILLSHKKECIWVSSNEQCWASFHGVC